MIPLPSGALEWAHAFDIRLVHGQVPCEGRVLERITVRAVVMRGDELLLVHSSVNGDLMFPGGGIEAGECHHTALARELREECGAELVAVGLLLGQTREFRAAREADYDAYCIRSFYYLCQVGEDWCEPHPQPFRYVLASLRAGLPWKRPCRPTRPSWPAPAPSGLCVRPGYWPSCSTGQRPGC